MRNYFILFLVSFFFCIIFFKFYKSEQIQEIQTCIDISSDVDLQYYCTAANSPYYDRLLNLIASIHRYNFDQLGHIAVFNLGLNASQLHHLSNIQKVGVYEIERANPYILTVFKVNPEGKLVPGWYSWKPVAIKQAFDLFPAGAAFLWIDAGTTILQDISALFEYIKYHGFFFHNGWQVPIRRYITQFVVHELHLNSSELNWILKDDTYQVESGLMGFSSEIYDSIIFPLYNLAKDIRYFANDGTTKEGFGNARPEQTLFSLLIRRNELLVFDHFKDPYAPFILECGNKKIPFYIASLTMYAHNKTHICCSRDNIDIVKKNMKYLKYKNRISENLIIEGEDELT